MQKCVGNNRLIVFLLCLGTFLSGCAAQGSYLRLDSSLQKDVRVFDSVQYVPLIRICEAYDLNWKWDPFIKTAIIERRGKEIVLRAGSDRILSNGVEKRLERSVLMDGGTVFIPASFVRNNLGSIAESGSFARLTAPAVSKRFAIKTIVIDAGHGGKDPGARGRQTRVKEKDLTLVIAKRLKGILEGKGIRVAMTRETDDYISLPKRADIANRSNADLFISIHVNSSRSRSLKGFECYYLSDATDDNARALEAFENASLEMEDGTILGHSKGLDKALWDMALTENRLESIDLAGRICDIIEDDLAIRNRGIRSARFYVLKKVRMPSVLVEMGYLSNRYEEMKFRDDTFVERMTNAVAKGILAYKDEYERTEGFTKT